MVRLRSIQILIKLDFNWSVMDETTGVRTRGRSLEHMNQSYEHSIWYHLVAERLRDQCTSRFLMVQLGRASTCNRELVFHSNPRTSIELRKLGFAFNIRERFQCFLLSGNVFDLRRGSPVLKSLRGFKLSNDKISFRPIINSTGDVPVSAC